ncbi:MAG: hypothetical protein JNL90_10615 [Planctomycetes bacterium]|nr:hypothetical protein [Planctomycetota bacterium]
MAAPDSQRLERLLRFVCAIYRTEFTEALFTAFALALDGAAIGDVEAAATAHVRSSRFFPAPCDLLRSAAEPDAELEAARAWLRVEELAKIERAPDGREIEKLDGATNWSYVASERCKTRLEDAVTLEAINLVGGWGAIKAQDGRDFRRRDFLNLHRKLTLERRAEESRSLPADEFRSALQDGGSS